VETTFAEVLHHFCDRSPGARRRFDAWRGDPHKAEVVPYVEHTVTRVPYVLKSSDIEGVCRRTVHALGKVKRTDAESVPEIVDWHPAFAFEHVVHHATETLGHVPTYQEFRVFCLNDALAEAMLLRPAREQARFAESAGHVPEVVRASIQWRVGNAYLSYLREMYVIAVLREEGLDVRYHLLADVLFRVDCWVKDTCVGIYVRNVKFRAGRRGRKPRVQEILGEGPFAFVELELAPRHEFGTVHLPERSSIVAAGSRIRA
jgi:hypothetical protein